MRFKVCKPPNVNPLTPTVRCGLTWGIYYVYIPTRVNLTPWLKVGFITRCGLNPTHGKPHQLNLTHCIARRSTPPTPPLTNPTVGGLLAGKTKTMSPESLNKIPRIIPEAFALA